MKGYVYISRTLSSLRTTHFSAVKLDPGDGPPRLSQPCRPSPGPGESAQRPGPNRNEPSRPSVAGHARLPWEPAQVGAWLAAVPGRWPAGPGPPGGPGSPATRRGPGESPHCASESPHCAGSLAVQLRSHWQPGPVICRRFRVRLRLSRLGGGSGATAPARPGPRRDHSGCRQAAVRRGCRVSGCLVREDGTGPHRTVHLCPGAAARSLRTVRAGAEPRPRLRASG
jgi:hypothetical protein